MKIVSTVLALMLISGCTTLKDADNARGTGVQASYAKPYDEVWNKTIDIINESKLDLISKDKEDGKMLAQKGMSALSYGENVAVFLEKKSESATQVEVVSKRTLAANITAKNWGSYIHTKLKEAFGNSNQ